MYDSLMKVTCSFENKSARLSNGQATWVQLAKKSQRADIKQLLDKLDEIVSAMPATETDKLKTRLDQIIPDGALQFIEEYDRQFTDAIVEILGYGLLIKKYPSHKVEFCEPDLIVRDDSGSLVAAMACKKINESEVNRDYLNHHQGEAMCLNTSLTSSNPSENPFLYKLNDTVTKAEEQLNRAKARDKFIFVDFTFDISALLQGKAVNQLIKSVGDNLRNKGIKFIACKNYEVDKPFFC